MFDRFHILFRYLEVVLVGIELENTNGKVLRTEGSIPTIQQQSHFNIFIDSLQQTLAKEHVGILGCDVVSSHQSCRNVMIDMRLIIQTNIQYLLLF